MPSFQDSAVIFVIALLLFGPKKLPELARQLGKLMGEFRRASNDFRMQMEDELRMAEQADRQKKIAAMEAAAPATPELAAPYEYPVEEHPHMPPVEMEEAAVLPVGAELLPEEPQVLPAAAEVLPIATQGDLKMMPPQTGLPVGRGAAPVDDGSALGPLLEAIPEAVDPDAHAIPMPERARVDQHG